MSIYEFRVCIDHDYPQEWCETGVIYAESFESALEKLKKFYRDDTITIMELCYLVNSDVYIQDGFYLA